MDPDKFGKIPLFSSILDASKFTGENIPAVEYHIYREQLFYGNQTRDNTKPFSPYAQTLASKFPSDFRYASFVNSPFQEVKHFQEEYVNSNNPSVGFTASQEKCKKEKELEDMLLDDSFEADESFDITEFINGSDDYCTDVTTPKVTHISHNTWSTPKTLPQKTIRTMSWKTSLPQNTLRSMSWKTSAPQNTLRSMSWKTSAPQKPAPPKRQIKACVKKIDLRAQKYIVNEDEEAEDESDEDDSEDDDETDDEETDDEETDDEETDASEEDDNEVSANDNKHQGYFHGGDDEAGNSEDEIDVETVVENVNPVSVAQTTKTEIIVPEKVVPENMEVKCMQAQGVKIEGGPLAEEDLILEAKDVASLLMKFEATESADLNFSNEPLSDLCSNLSEEAFEFDNLNRQYKKENTFVSHCDMLTDSGITSNSSTNHSIEYSQYLLDSPISTDFLRTPHSLPKNIFDDGSDNLLAPEMDLSPVSVVNSFHRDIRNNQIKKIEEVPVIKAEPITSDYEQRNFVTEKVENAQCVNVKTEKLEEVTELKYAILDLFDDIVYQPRNVELTNDMESTHFVNSKAPEECDTIVTIKTESKSEIAAAADCKKQIPDIPSAPSTLSLEKRTTKPPLPITTKPPLPITTKPPLPISKTRKECKVPEEVIARIKKETNKRKTISVISPPVMPKKRRCVSRSQECRKNQPVKTEPVNIEPVKTEPIKVEPAKVEPAKVEPAKLESPKNIVVKSELPKPESCTEHILESNFALADHTYASKASPHVSLSHLHIKNPPSPCKYQEVHIPNKQKNIEPIVHCDKVTIIKSQPTIKNADGQLMVSLLRSNTIHTTENATKKKLNLDEYKRRRHIVNKPAKSQSNSTASSNNNSPARVQSHDDEVIRQIKVKQKMMKMAEDILKTTPKSAVKTEQTTPKPVVKIKQPAPKQQKIIPQKAIPAVKIPEKKPKNIECKMLLSIGVNTDPIVGPVDELQNIAPLLTTGKFDSNSLIHSIVENQVKTQPNDRKSCKFIGEDKTIIHLPKIRPAVVKKNALVQTDLTLIAQIKKMQKNAEKHSNCDTGSTKLSPHCSSESSRSSSYSSSPDSRRRSGGHRRRRRSSSSSSSCSSSRGYNSKSRSSRYSTSSHSRSSSRSRTRSPSRIRWHGSNSGGRQYRRSIRHTPDPEFKREVEQRCVIFVGNIGRNTTEADLRRRFQRFGPIKRINLHMREKQEFGYGFVTFYDRADAVDAIDHGNDDPALPHYEIGFGGRRVFCNAPYSDLDNMRDEMSYDPNDMSAEDLNYHNLLSKFVTERKRVVT